MECGRPINYMIIVNGVPLDDLEWFEECYYYKPLREASREKDRIEEKHEEFIIYDKH